MAQEVFNLKQAAEHVHLDVNELRHAAQRGEIAANEHAGDWFFRHRDLDEWAQRNLLSAGAKEQDRQHQSMQALRRRAKSAELRLAELIRLEGVELELPSKARAGAIRDMSGLAARTGLVYDADGLFNELKEREDIASTAVGQGAAFLHPRFHDPYLFEETFLAYGRSARGVFFGAPDDAATRHFFLICATDHEVHLHILARLAVLAHSETFLAALDAAETPEAVVAAVAAAESALLGQPGRA